MHAPALCTFSNSAVWVPQLDQSRDQYRAFPSVIIHEFKVGRLQYKFCYTAFSLRQTAIVDRNQ